MSKNNYYALLKIKYYGITCECVFSKHFLILDILPIEKSKFIMIDD